MERRGRRGGKGRREGKNGEEGKRRRRWEEGRTRKESGRFGVRKGEGGGGRGEDCIAWSLVNTSLRCCLCFSSVLEPCRTVELACAPPDPVLFAKTSPVVSKLSLIHIYSILLFIACIRLQIRLSPIL